jgi:hypothetical protein
MGWSVPAPAGRTLFETGLGSPISSHQPDGSSLPLCWNSMWFGERSGCNGAAVCRMPWVWFGGGATQLMRLARAFRRWRACRSSCDSPPQTPAPWPDSTAPFRQPPATSQRRQEAFVFSIWSGVEWAFPIGKKVSGLSSRQAARLRQVIRNQGP